MQVIARREIVICKASSAGNGMPFSRMTTQQMAVSRLARREAPQIPQSGVAVLDKGGAIACELRLVLGNLGASIIYIQFRTAH